MESNTFIIPGEFVSLIEKNKAKKIIAPGELIYGEQERAEHFYYLKKGRIKIFVTSDSGIEKALAIYNQTTFFGEASFFDGFPRMSSARALETSQIIAISRMDIRNWFRHDPDLALSMIASLSKTIRMLSAQINQISFLSADKRLANFLLEETRYDRSAISFTHEEIGALIGANRVTVSRILREFRKKEWIETGYGSIHINSRESLRRFLDT